MAEIETAADRAAAEYNISSSLRRQAAAAAAALGRGASAAAAAVLRPRWLQLAPSQHNQQQQPKHGRQNLML